MIEKTPNATPEGQKHMMYANDPAQRMGAMLRQAEEMGLTRADVEAAQRRFPGRYDCLTYWRATDEK